ncbi:hypothetical protein AURDEDRAFT_174622 [Auricularia subglabra TFB-10046 SS5]|uniref:Uncharacterized protein n=1 Tax=Auricularia subglabra (strain TFB-10046 / SS5) TaxID=717982 RepID=J0D962_AURST|nr:hypothetical protein AURDEDRAFT_174622 [Auricularia subglabra TFB-10046 SS5]
MGGLSLDCVRFSAMRVCFLELLPIGIPSFSPRLHWLAGSPLGGGGGGEN